MKTTALLALAALLPSCSAVQRGGERGARPAFYRPLATTPQEVRAYLRAHVPAKTLRVWENAVSDEKAALDAAEQAAERAQ